MASFQTSPFCQNLEIRNAGSVFSKILADIAGVILKKKHRESQFIVLYLSVVDYQAGSSVVGSEVGIFTFM